MDNKFVLLFKSRKFWALAIALTGIWTAVYLKTLPVADAINASVAALAAYSIGTGLEDGGTAAKG